MPPRRHRNRRDKVSNVLSDDRTRLIGEAYSRQTRYQVPVIALHCSGAGASEWYSLAEALGDDYGLLAPEHYGSASNGAWTGEHAFTLADDAARAIALVDGQCRSQARASLRNRHIGRSIMGFEDEVEQSFGRPCRRQVQADMRTHLIHRPARDTIPPLGGARVSS